MARASRAPWRLLVVFARALRRVPRAAWTCALIAIVNAACWSVITPPLQAPDEPSHFAYAQWLAETGQLPTSSHGYFSQEELNVMQGLNQAQVEWHSEVPTITSPAAQRQLSEDLELPLSRVGHGGAGVAASEPPLFYALETIPYYLGTAGTMLDRLELMRLLSALMAGVTTLFTFLFLRELLPGVRWAWTVGALAVALTPLLATTSSVVTPDAMLPAVAAATLFSLARAFRRGLTRRRAVAIGGLLAVGFLTKLNFIGLVPGVMLGLVVLAFRGVPDESGTGRARRAFGSMLIAMVIAVIPVCVYVLSNLLKHHHVLGIVSSTLQESHRWPLTDEASYIWQLYLPRLPGMRDYFPGISTIRQMWFDRTVGMYGWLDTTFPQWVYNLALIPAGLIALLALAGILARRHALRAHLSEFLVYVAMGVGLLALLGSDSFLHMPTEGAWAQPRYLLPLLPLGAAVLALAARAGGRRFGPALGALIVVLFLAQDVFSQLLVVSRFYY